MSGWSKRVPLARIAKAWSFAVVLLLATSASTAATALEAPRPLADASHPVDWWFAFKFNAATFPDSASDPDRNCAFGGAAPMAYPAFSQEYAVATSAAPELVKGPGLLGTGPSDPLGATFAEVYSGGFYYVVWNDQFYGHPDISGCTESCGAPWGHSKGLIAWNEAGEGLVLQVTTPSWPASGSAAHPREVDGNTLGCVSDNDVKVSQHFFALRLNADDVAKVLHALANASVVTKASDPSVFNAGDGVSTGGPAEVRAAVALLATKPAAKPSAPTREILSSGIVLISKPSAVHVPPWQLVSAFLDGVPLRTATWWATPKIPSTSATSEIGCWQQEVTGAPWTSQFASPAHPFAPGPVEIATSGTWQGAPIGLKGGPGKDFNHAKVGVSVGGTHPYVIFGDENQQGALSGKCNSSQNGRGGLFFVVQEPTLHTSVAALLEGGTAPVAP